MNSGQERSERTKGEHTPSADQLRGPNSSLRLLRLVENSLYFIGDYGPLDRANRKVFLQNAVSKLSGWVEPIDSTVRRVTSLKTFHNRIELEKIVEGLIESHTIPSNLDLWQILGDNKKNHFAFQHQWRLMEAIFRIDVSILGSGTEGGLSLPMPDYRDYEPDRIHKIMFGLVKKAVLARGGIFKDDRSMLSFKASSLIDGITSKVIVENVNGYLNNIPHGYPNIVGISLGFSPSFLTSLRSLRGEEDYQKYFQGQERQHSEGQQGYREQGNRGQRKEEPKTEPRQEQRNEGFRRGPEGQDPRDPQGYYKTLGINPDTDPEDIQDVLLATYRRLARKYHSDTGGEKANEGRMKAINAAYEFLNNAGKRRNYGRGS